VKVFTDADTTLESNPPPPFIGIDPQMTSRVFELFAQAPRAPHQTSGGLGVGLTLARRIAQLHGGDVEGFSEGPGKGSEFVLWLPLTDPDLTIEPTEGELPRLSESYRVLIVEDNPDASDALHMLLELLGHKVRVVRDGPSALEAVRANAPDVALVDIGLPGMDGYEVARRARPLATPGRMTLIALTGYGRDEDKARALAAGFDYHLTKPVDVDALRSLLSGAGPAHVTQTRPAFRL